MWKITKLDFKMTEDKPPVEYKEHTTFLLKDITVNYDQLEDLFHVMFIIVQNGTEQVTRYSLQPEFFTGFFTKVRNAIETRDLYKKKSGGYFD